MGKTKVSATGRGYLGETMVHKISREVGVVENVVEAQAGWPPEITLKLKNGSFKKGKQITLTSVNFQNQPNPIKVALTGFGDAYDGPPLQQSDIEDRQKKLQDFVAKNNQDFAKKLKEEQDKAKTAN